ncbi:MAG: hypothetical protein ACJ8KF_09830 [Chthoniobacterales bacterium]
MNTYFVRHNIGIDIDDETRGRLWKERRIAIHYPHEKNGKLKQRDNSSLDANDYVGSAKRLHEKVAGGCGAGRLRMRSASFAAAMDAWTGQTEFKSRTRPWYMGR